MKKVVAMVLAVICLQITVFADIKDVSYTYDEEYLQTLSSGYRCRAYMGELKFSVDEKSPEGVGCVVYYFGVYNECYYADIPFVGDLSRSNFSMRLAGLGFEATDYKIVPYYIKDGERILGEEKTFSISETCMALANLRVAYDQIQKIEFDEKEQEIINLVLPVVKKTIEAGESGEVEINKSYLAKTYPDEIAEAKKRYDEMDYNTEGKDLIRKLETGIEKAAQSYVISHFY